jgi:3-oxoacyl-[acyl-carrier-protein] synthase II
MQGRSIFKRSPIEQRRVVVTGIGTVSPLGLTVDETWQNALNGKPGIERITRFDTSAYDSKIAGEVKGFNSDLYVPKKEQKKMDLFIHFAMAAQQMALKDSGLTITENMQERVGVYVGSGIGGLPGIEKVYDTLKERGPSRITPFFIPMVISNMAGGQISMATGAKGPNICAVTACSTGAHCIGEAAQYIRNGLTDVMIVGGTEATICGLAVGGFSAMKALSTRNETPHSASRPWDKDRDGFVLGEGSAILILEDYEHAARRDARIYGELLGYGVSSDAYHMTNPSPGGEGASRAMKLALRDASLNPEQIDYINAHGTSTPAGDDLETQGIKRAFGSHAAKLWVSSTKSMTGHLLGAAGALESLFCLLALRDGAVPPTINLENPSENCDLDYVPLTSRQKKVQIVMNNSFGFGGTNACLIFAKI